MRGAVFALDVIITSSSVGLYTRKSFVDPRSCPVLPSDRGGCDGSVVLGVVVVGGAESCWRTHREGSIHIGGGWHASKVDRGL